MSLDKIKNFFIITYQLICKIPITMYIFGFAALIIYFEASSFLSGMNYLITKYQWEGAFLKLSNAYYQITADYGGLEPRTSRDDVMRILIGNLKVTKLCKNSVKDLCWPEKSFYTDGTPSYTYENFPGFVVHTGAGEVYVSGIQDTTSNCSNYNICNIISVDINGLRGPNTFGKDQFRFYYYQDKVVPYYPGDDKLIGTIVKSFLYLR